MIAMGKTLLAILAVFICIIGCKERNDLSIKLLREIDLAAKLKPGEQKLIEISDEYVSDIFVISRAYLNANYAIEEARKFGLSQKVAKQIVSISGSQDGIYFYRIKNGKIVEELELGAQVNTKEDIRFHLIDRSKLIKLSMKDTAYRPLWISIDEKRK